MTLGTRTILFSELEKMRADVHVLQCRCQEERALNMFVVLEELAACLTDAIAELRPDPPEVR